MTRILLTLENLSIQAILHHFFFEDPPLFTVSFTVVFGLLLTVDCFTILPVMALRPLFPAAFFPPVLVAIVISFVWSIPAHYTTRISGPHP